jgi:Rrf2 family nitric oxide-sensitive transcriptional repressor
MQLTQFSDYALRILLYLGTHDPQPGQRLPALADIGRAYSISYNHLSKVAQQLAALGFIDAMRGRTGGIRLARPPAQINLGAVVRATESHFNLVECFDRETNTCPIAPVCGLTRALLEARDSFLAVLDRYTLADVLVHKQELIRLWRVNASPARTH